jgi:ABC-2 type transport system permease protein
VRAIFWAQTRALMNYSFRRSGVLPHVLTAVFLLVWYGMWVFLASVTYRIASSPEGLNTLRRALPLGLLVVFGYWQVVPLLMASSGLSLDLRRLLVYPIAHGWLFTLEVALRVSTAVEMLLITAGLALGLIVNPLLPWWAALPLIPFTAANLLLSAGLRDLFTRWMARKHFREALIFALVLLTGLPQVLLLTGAEEKIAGMRTDGFGAWWPWSLTAALVLGAASLASWTALTGWTAAAWWFGRRQFERALRFDAAEAGASKRPPADRRTLADRLLALPTRLLRDPLAALLEKELRFLSRAPRFRLLFLMGFSFGLLVWLPLAFRGDEDSVMRTNYLTFVSAYALMLLGEVCFWNSFGLDRSAAQTYFVMPVRLSTVIVAKNLAATTFIALELGAVALFCALLRLPVTAESVAEAFASTAVLALFMLAAGNLLSVRHPRPVDPAQSWRSGSMTRVQAYLLLLYPLASAPVLLAHMARYAFDSDLAFYGVLALDVLIGAVVYGVALDSAVAVAENRRERMLEALSGGEGPVSV